jgi:hypothetical protein
MPETYHKYYLNGKLNIGATKRNFFNLVDPLDPLLNKYLRLDCNSLYEIITKAIKISGLDIKRFTDCPTTATLSMTIFKELFPDQYDHATRTNWSGQKNEMVEWFLRKGYYGGRTEVFKAEQRGGFYMDKNSMYPHCMRNYSFPCGEFRDYSGSMAESCWDLFCFDNKGGGMIEADVFIPKMKIPPLPHRAKDKNNKLIFPCGYISGVWTFHELKFAMNRGVKILNVKRTVYFPMMSQIFIGFVNYFEQLKIDNTEAVKYSGVNAKGEKINPSLREWAKLILNALYGKFASRRERDSYTSIAEIEQTIKKLKHKKNDRYYQRQIEFFEDVLEHGGIEAEQMWIEKEMESGFFPMHFYHSELEEEIFKYNSYLEAPYIQVQISAYITSYARMELYQAIETVLKNNGEPAYCDTDSLMSSIKLPEEMLHKTEFGKWDIEHEIDHVILLSEKMYGLKSADGKQINKGKGNPKEIMALKEMDEWEQWLQHVINKDVDTIPIVTEADDIQQKTNFLAALTNNKDFNEIRILEKSINIRNRQPKRKMLPDGSTEPWYYENGFSDIEEDFQEIINNDVAAAREEIEREEELTLENMLKQYGKIKIPDQPHYKKLYEGLKKKTQKMFFGKKGMDLFEWCLKYESAPDCTFTDMELNI